MQSYRAIFSRLFMLSCPDSMNYKNLRVQPSGHTRKYIKVIRRFITYIV